MTTLTNKQRQAWEAVQTHGSNRKAAEALGVNASTIDAHMAAARKKMENPAVEALYTAIHQHPSFSKEGAHAAFAHLVQAPEARQGKRILVLPDVQAKPGIDFSYLRRIGLYMVEKKPDIVVCIGDFADMPSLSSYDKGKKSYEGRRYKRDVEAAQFAMQAFLGPLNEYNATSKVPYRPRLVMTLGNHEERILRAANDDPKLDGLIATKDLAYEEYGWEVYPFLEVVIIEGVAFSHFFATGVMGRPASSAAAQLRVANMSCFSGHQQGKQIAYAKRADGAILTSIITGSCYEHEESYLGPQVNKQHWRGFFVLHEVKNGTFDEMPVSLSYINGRFPGAKVDPPIYSMPTEAEIQAGRC